jgi:hypothetical protein
MRFLVLLAIVAAAAFFTRPGPAAMQQAADARLAAVTEAAANNADLGGALGGLAAQVSVGRYDNYYVVGHYVTPARGAPLVECWGAFTQSVCNKVGSPQ